MTIKRAVETTDPIGFVLPSDGEFTCGYAINPNASTVTQKHTIQGGIQINLEEGYTFVDEPKPWRDHYEPVF